MAAREVDDLTPAAVCIPAHGDESALAHTLASLGRARRRSDAYVIVAVDGPDDALARAAERGGADHVVVLSANAGSYAARNAAIDAIPDDVTAVLFTDSDVAVHERWIESHLTALRDADRSGGRIEIRLSSDPSPAEVVDASRHLDQQFYVETLGYAATANLAVRRRVLDAVRFDPTLRSGGDFEFGRRCAAAGYDIAFTPDAVVFHPARRSTSALLTKMRRVGQGAAALGAHGYRSTERRRTRPALRDVAAGAGLRPSPVWMLQARAIDVGCSVAFARHNPEVILPAIRRKLRSLA
jgi:glycosyltransferase AglI